MASGMTRGFGEFIARARHVTALSDTVRTRSKRALLDALGCALIGSRTEVAAAAQRHAAAFGSVRPAGASIVWGVGGIKVRSICFSSEFIVRFKPNVPFSRRSRENMTANPSPGVSSGRRTRERRLGARARFRRHVAPSDAPKRPRTSGRPRAR